MAASESKRIEECWHCGKRKPVYTVSLTRYRWEDNLWGKLESEGGTQALLCDECSCKLNRVFHSYIR